jgi:PKD repeat protein
MWGKKFILPFILAIFICGILVSVDSGNALNTPPIANFIFTPEDPITGEKVTLDASLSSDSDGFIKVYEWDIDNDSFYERIGTTSELTWFTEGSYPVTLRVTDNGSESNTTTRIITIYAPPADTTPPETYLSGGPSGLINTNSATFTWSGTDETSPSLDLLYSFRLNNYDTTWSTWVADTTITYTFLPDGEYTFNVKAKDIAGNEDITPATQSFIVDTKGPLAPIISSSTHPHQNQQYCSPYIILSWIPPADSSGIACYIYDMYFVPTTPYGTCKDTTIAYYNNLDYGIHYFNIRAMDNAGNLGEISHFKIDIERCEINDGWYYTLEYRWIDDTLNPCQEKEQRQQNYRDYTCQGGTCQYIVTETKWVDTSRLRDKPNNTICDQGPWEVDPSNVCRERRIVYYCHNGSCKHDTYSYEYRHKIDGTGCGGDFYDDWVYYCVGDTIRRHRLFHDFFCEDGECRDHTSWRDDEFIENCSVKDGWYETGVIRWINDSGNPCCEKEQKEETFCDYTCSGGQCGHSVTDSRWSDTGVSRMKPDGTVCGYGVWEDDPGDVCRERRLVFLCENGTCQENHYEYQNKTNITCVRVIPPHQACIAGSHFTMNITVTPHKHLAGAQCDLYFNPAHLTIETIKEGDLFNQGDIDTFFTNGTINNTLGVIKGVACVITDPGESVTKPGTLAIITGQISDTMGSTNITLSNVIAGDPNGLPYPLGVLNGTITLMQNTAPDTPEKPAGPTQGTPDKKYTYSSFTTDPNGDDLRYQFHWGNTLGNWTDFISSGISVNDTHTWNEPGIYTVKIKTKDQHGKESNWSLPLTVHITAPSQNTYPVATLRANISQGTSPLRVSFQLNAYDDGSIASWDLDINNDGVSDYSGDNTPPTHIHHLYMTPGTYTPLFSVTDTDGKTDKSRVIITVASPLNLSPTANFTYSSHTPLSSADPIMFQDTSTDTDGYIVNWTWEINSHNYSDTQYGKNTTIIFPYPSNYTVSLYVEDNQGDNNSYSINLEIHPDDSSSKDTPGFQVVVLIVVLICMVYIRRNIRI